MEEYNYTNWEQEREILIDDILNILRVSEDFNQEVTYSGEVTFNPQVFAQEGFRHLTMGPIEFNAPFKAAPRVFFSQRPAINPASLAIYSTNNASSYKPYLVSPYVYNFSVVSGAVDGFYLGLYDSNEESPDLSLVKTSIYWLAVGESTRYKDEALQESWTDVVDYNEPDYLVSSD